MPDTPGKTALAELGKLLDQALELPPNDRGPWLQQRALEQPSLQPLIERLLPSLTGSDGARWSPHAQWAAEPMVRAGESVGPWLLLRELGRGGMAEVWLAQRHDGAFERQVALKLPRLSVARTALAERFQRERDILARLEHPHIARLYDAGVSHGGVPYLAMEFVEGRALTEHADAQRLPTRERLLLFLQVLEAIQYAHANLVIHRDLKPSNILVNDAGQVRVLDFGIAKLIADEAADARGGGNVAAATALTQHAGRVLTVAYASPEQLRGEPVSTASDVYSLGVVLFELLTGGRPYALAGTEAQLEAAILDTDPQRPEQALGRDDQARERANLRGTTASRLRRELAGDLAAVIRKAMAKSAGERYDGIAALRDDLRRWLEGRAVLAQPESLSYQLRKFVARNKLAVAWSATFALALVATAGVALWQANQAREQARIAAHQEQLARAVQDFLLGLFRANAEAQPDPLKAREATARELLDLGAARVQQQLANVPEVRETVLQTLAEMYGDIGLDQQAADLTGQRVQARLQLYGPDDVRVADVLIEHAGALNATPQVGRAPQLLRRAQEIIERSGGPHTERRIQILFGLAQALRYADVSAALGHAEQAQALIEQTGVARSSLRRALYLQGLTLGFLGECNQALAILRRAHELSLASPGPQGRWQIPEFAAMSSQALCLAEPALAEEMLQQALALSARVNGPDHIDTAHIQTRLVRVYSETSRVAQARELDGRLRALAQQPVVKENLNLFTTLLRTSAALELDTGRVAEADERLNDLVPRLRAYLGSGVVLAAVLQMHARARAGLGRHAEARPLLDEALEMMRRSIGPRGKPVALASLLIDQAALRRQSGGAAGAQEALATLDAVAAATPDGAPEMRAVWPMLARERAAALRALGRPQQAAEAAEAALARMAPPVARPEDRPRQRADLAFEIGMARLELAQVAAAREALKQAVVLRQANDDPASPVLATARAALARADRTRR